ncbi:MAG: 2-oxoglutarate dehydrogenase complex dihydrolipoyllysine-residue succinyltransferase [Gemmatimonadaceae bacterium]
MTSIKVPPLGESITEATVARWLKQEGDPVAAGDTLVELETDKITVEVPALKAGRLASQARAEGDIVKVDEVLGELDESAGSPGEGDTTGKGKQPKKAEAAEAAERATAKARPDEPGDAEADEKPQVVSAEEKAGARSTDGEARVSPAARRVASEAGVATQAVRGTGRGGVVSKPDVIEHIDSAQPRGAPDRSDAAPAASPRASRAPTTGAPSGNGARETREKMSTRRRRIAEHLLEAKQATASLTTFNEIDMSVVIDFRERMKEKVQKEHDVKLTYMPFFIKAACMALRDVPIVNAQLDGDSILFRHYVNMGIAVASEQGLVVPTIKDADSKGLIELSHDIATVANRARDGKLTMDDLTGGTFTITNGGVFGSLVSTPILNHPQVGILGLHKIEDRPIAVKGQVEIRPMMYVALSYDHRIVDGQFSVQFLVKVKQYMEDPATMLLS